MRSDIDLKTVLESFNLMTFLFLVLFLAVATWCGLTIRKLNKQLESKDLEIESLKVRGSEFIANVSHELKTPLTSIKGFTETLRSGAIRDPQRAEGFLQRIEENSERLSHLVNDILDLAKIESPNMYMESTAFKPDEVIEEIRKDFEYPLSARKQVLAIKNSVKDLIADKKLFGQALRNLIENAHRYCQDGTQIELSSQLVTEQGRVYARFVVSDNGPGIGPDDLPRIFERFYRADKSRNRALGGTGLGLAIVKHIMMSHGGFVRAASEPLKGATFSLYFPTTASSARLN